jgi:arylsulfatase A-like enzyme
MKIAELEEERNRGRFTWQRSMLELEWLFWGFFCGYIDGISIAPTLLGDQERQRRHDFLYWEYPQCNFREKTFSAANVATALRRGNWKLIRTTTSRPWELYNLESDPGEQNNMAAQHRDVVEELAALAKASHVDMPQVEPDMPSNVRFRQ